MRAEELWKTYCEKEKIDIDTPYEAWRFGDAPDKLADLVLKGIKTATASGYDLYFTEGEEEQLPQPGDYSVILDAKDEAVCVIQTTKTTVVPFDEVSEEHAYKEGEGDRSLAYWRSVHEEFFATVYKGNIIKNLIMDCQSYTKYRPNETTGGIFVSWRRKEELPTGA